MPPVARPRTSRMNLANSYAVSVHHRPSVPSRDSKDHDYNRRKHQADRHYRCIRVARVYQCVENGEHKRNQISYHVYAPRTQVTDMPVTEEIDQSGDDGEDRGYEADC